MSSISVNVSIEPYLILVICWASDSDVTLSLCVGVRSIFTCCGMNSTSQRLAAATARGVVMIVSRWSRQREATLQAPLFQLLPLWRKHYNC